MTNPGGRSSTPRSASPAPKGGSTFSRRRAVSLLVAAGIVALLALTSGWWLPILQTLSVAAGGPTEVIGFLADMAQLVSVVLWAVTVLLGYLGLRSYRSFNAGGETPQAVEAAQEGWGVAVGGDVNRGAAVVVGNYNRLEVSGDVTYDYRDVAPSPVDEATIEEARRRLEGLPLEEVPGRAALPPGSVMPLRPNRHFVGREEQLKRIAANLKAGDATTISEVMVAASTGLGGMGKTQLACEFVYRYGEYFHGVYWVSFAEPGGVPAEIASCGGTRGMNLRSDFHTLPLEERVRAVMAAWQGDLPRLLVFDNCEDEDLLDQWLPTTGGCRVLVTSRRGHWDAALGVIDLPLDVLDRRESVALLRKYRSDLPVDQPDLDAIADELGDLPLALDLAGRYLDKYRHEVRPDAYLADIRRPELLEHSSLRRARGISPTKHDMDVWRTFALSYWRLDAKDATDGTAVRLLARAARLAPGEPIPNALLAWTLEPPDGDDGPPQPTTTVRDALNRLADLGLLEESGGETLRMHRLVAAFAHAGVPDDGAQAAVEIACARAAGRAHWEGQLAWQEALLPHLRFVTDSAKGRVDNMAANCCTALGLALQQLGAYDEALLYAERAWDISVNFHGPYHRATLQRRSNIGVLFRKRRDWLEARTIYEEVLAVQEGTLGPEDPDVAATINNLGVLLRQEDLYHEVLPLYRRALRIRQDVWERTGPDDPDRKENAYEAAESHSNMGALLMDLGRHREAQPHLESALDIRGGEFGKYHALNAGTFVNLGRALRAQGDYPRAGGTLTIALDIYRNVSKTMPPDAASAFTNLGAVFEEWAETHTQSAPQRTRALEVARDSLAQALNGSEQLYGEEDPLTGGILRALAGVRDAQGATEDSRRYQVRAETCRQQNFQAGEADAANRLNSHGTSLMNHGLYDEAHAYLERALAIRERVSEERPFDTSSSLLKLGILLQLRGRDEQARPYLERALAARASVCGETHPATELVRDNLRLLNG